MTRAELVEFMRRHVYAVEASVAASGAPQAAVVGIVVTDALEIFFDTMDDSRKAANLRRSPRVAFVIGGTHAGDERTVQDRRNRRRAPRCRAPAPAGLVLRKVSGRPRAAAVAGLHLPPRAPHLDPLQQFRRHSARDRRAHAGTARRLKTEISTSPPPARRDSRRCWPARGCPPASPSCAGRRRRPRGWARSGISRSWGRSARACSAVPRIRCTR